MSNTGSNPKIKSTTVWPVIAITLFIIVVIIDIYDFAKGNPTTHPTVTTEATR